MSQAPLFDQIDQLRAAEARDELFYVAVNIVREHGRGSVNLLQRKLRIGYTRAARLVDQLHAAGILGPDQGGTRGREYLGDDLPVRATVRYSDDEDAASGRRWDDEADDNALDDDEGWDDAPPWEDDTPAQHHVIPEGENETDGTAARDTTPSPPPPTKPAPPTIWF